MAGRKVAVFRGTELLLLLALHPGCKLSSNCSKEWSGTKTELMNKVEKIKKSIEYLVKKHKEEDENPTDPNQIEREKKSIEKLKAKADKISTWLKCSNYKANGGKHTGVTFKGHVHSCQTCDFRKKCLRNEKTKARQVTILSKGKDAPSCNYSEIMRQRFDTPYRRQVYSKRMGTIEPVFGNIRGTKKLNHFTLRGSKKVNIQWLLFCLVHNIGKVQVFGKSM